MRHTTAGAFDLPIAASEAIGFFTPEGERDWVPGWDPSYPDGEASERSGTVFTTSADDVVTIWTIIEIDRDGGRSAYARTTPGRHAGTVDVTCQSMAHDRCRVKVSYDMTLSSDADPSLLAPYSQDAIEEMLPEWRALIMTWLKDDSDR